MNAFEGNNNEKVNDAPKDNQVIDNETPITDEETTTPQRDNPPMVENDTIESQSDDSSAEDSDLVGAEVHDTPQEDDELHESQKNDSEDDSPEESVTMEDFEETMVTLRAGQLIKGTVLSVNESEVIVNIGYKSDGIIPLNELTLDNDQSPLDLYNPGDEVEVEVLKVKDEEGNVILSRKSVERKRAWQAIEKGLETGEEFEGKCTEAVKGGVIAKIGDIRAFVPASQLSNRYIEDLSTFVGKTLRLRIIELERRRRRVVASQRLYWRQKKKKDNKNSGLQLKKANESTV